MQNHTSLTDTQWTLENNTAGVKCLHGENAEGCLMMNQHRLKELYCGTVLKFIKVTRC